MVIGARFTVIGGAMFRRDLLQRVAIGAAACVTGLGKTAQAVDRETVTYTVKGFSCPTCAIGLDTLLREQKGVVRSKSTYPEGLVTIEFAKGVITPQEIMAVITKQGFTIANSAPTATGR